MKQLVVNADDLGMTRGINRAIVEAHRGGVVTSASLIANGAAFDDAVVRLRQAPQLSVGLHVNFTEGRPLRTGIRSLVDRHGAFHGPAALAVRLTMGAVSAGDLEQELGAQAERVAGAGIRLSHLDSHHNIHLHPVAAAALANAARRLNVRWIRFRGQRPISPAIKQATLEKKLDGRARHLVALLGFRLCTRRGELSKAAPRWIAGAPQDRHQVPGEQFAAMAGSIKHGVTEWVCHPGYADAELRAMLSAQAAHRRQEELALLTDPDTRSRLEAAGIVLVNYAELGK